MAFTKSKYGSPNETAALPLGGHAPKAIGGTCPRCATRLSYNGEDLICLQCGYANYAKVEIGIGERQERWTDPVGTMDRICYGGTDPKYGETSLNIERVHYSPNIKYKPTCPYACGQRMRTLKKDRKRKSELNYLCPDGHEVTIVTTRDGDSHWK